MFNPVSVPQGGIIEVVGFMREEEKA